MSDSPIRDLTAALREVSDDEFKALVAIETAERLAVRAYRAIESGDTEEAKRLLLALTDVTTTRTVTAVKDQSVSDGISMRAHTAISQIMAARPQPEDSDDQNAAEHAEQTRQRYTPEPQYGLIGRPDRPGGV